MEVRLGITNPTALLGKSSLVNDWRCHILSFSESSHTRKAARALGSEFRRFGYSLSLSTHVPDKFPVGNPSGSFRGLSRGVALASKFPVYSPRPSFLPLMCSDSQRILYSVVQIGQIPVHIVTAYLFPCAPPGTQKYRLNCQILAWAHEILNNVSGPTCLCGDFNAPLASFDTTRQLLSEGWEDMALLCHRSFNSPLDPTCKGSTRHTFGIGNSDLCRFLKWACVDFEFDLDAHAVQVFTFQMPTYPVVLILLLSTKLRWNAMHLALFTRSTKRSPTMHIALGNMDDALRIWSAKCEALLMRHSLTEEGVPPKGSHFKGRAQAVEPVRRALAPPRFKQGRQGDFCVSCPSTALEVRQVQKQARRIQAYVRTLSCSFFGTVQRAKCVELWTAILRSSGFKPCFPTWVQDWAQKLASRRWRAKRQEFALLVDSSWKAKGGRIPFALLRENPLPPVTDLRVQLEVQLAPQRWSPVGKAWFTVLNVSDFCIGDCLRSDDLSVKILEVRDEYVHVDRLLSRRQASRLTKTFTTADPNVWCPHFMQKWSAFWNRDLDDDSVSSDEFLPLLPQRTPRRLGPLTWDDWVRALKCAKSHSMRGADSWSIPELKYTQTPGRSSVEDLRCC